MPRTCCLQCHLRFSSDMAVTTTSCPFCGEPVTRISAHQALGFALIAARWTVDDDLRVERVARMEHGERPR